MVTGAARILGLDLLGLLLRQAGEGPGVRR
jgi:hypothetical protein